MKTLPAILAAALVASLAPLPAAAQQATELGSFGAWTAWKGADADGATCYISATPRSSQPSGVNRDPISFIVIHRQGGGTRNEVQSILGYPVNATDPKASADIDGNSYGMVADGSVVWLADASAESGFVEAMKAGSTMVVRATSQRGTDTVDTYSLSGATKAMEAIDTACS